MGLADAFYEGTLEVILHLYDLCPFISAICNIQCTGVHRAAAQLERGGHPVQGDLVTRLPLLVLANIYICMLNNPLYICS